MNELNPLETQLGSWRPRPPAGRLRARLFANSAQTPSFLAGGTFWWRLSPVLGCLLLTLLSLQSNPQPASNAGSLPANRLLATLAWSDQFVILGADGDFNRNRWQLATFESTKTSPSNSTMSSFRLVRTNSLIND